ncbi:hypothetical protein D3C75_725940 [compost metagenome]
MVRQIVQLAAENKHRLLLLQLIHNGAAVQPQPDHLPGGGLQLPVPFLMGVVGIHYTGELPLIVVHDAAVGDDVDGGDIIPGVVDSADVVGDRPVIDHLDGRFAVPLLHQPQHLVIAVQGFGDAVITLQQEIEEVNSLGHILFRHLLGLAVDDARQLMVISHAEHDDQHQHTGENQQKQPHVQRV